MKRFMTTAFALVLAVSASQGALAGDAGNGKKLFNKKCKTCHTIEKNGKNKVGPKLYGAFGRKASSVEGFRYSNAFKELDLTWDEAALHKLLTKPRKFAKGTKMSFAGLKKQSERDDVIAFLKENGD